MKLENKIFSMIVFLVLVTAIMAGCEDSVIEPENESKISRFKSGEELLNAFEEASKRNRGFGFMEKGAVLTMAESAPQADAASGREYSETNIQVEGVDEADIIKTDGNYIYVIAQGHLVIAKAHPAAKILSTTKFNDFYPNELFIHKNRLLVFGSSNYRFEEKPGELVNRIRHYPMYMNFMTLELYDTSDKENPELIKTIDFEGSYLTSRKIGSDVYFVVNSYPHYDRNRPCIEILPVYRESDTNEKPQLEDMQPIAGCVDIGYIEPIQAESFITVASVSMIDESVEKEVIVGSGQNVYASLQNLYIAQTTWPVYNAIGGLRDDYVQKTVVTKFKLDDGKIVFSGKGEVKGHILNQFSMDEFDGHFRIATTIGNVWDREKKSTNNVYVLGGDLEVVGELEDLAPGERIYSVRFMGEKGYVVTFKKVDPLFVIDLSEHENPFVLGKLKIPGYSDYLHPYDETHIIGIGKDTVEAEEELKEGRGVDFAWYQGIKMAIFDVSDVENPIEMHKIVIGDRGTDSPALHDHKAFLFDREKNLLVIPITLAEIKGEETADNQYGDYVFQGAYVYDITLSDGFDLRGRVTHYDDDEAFKKSGFYFRGDSSIKRSLYIENVLYTLSDNRLQLNSLYDLDRLDILEFEKGDQRRYPEVLY